MWYSDLSRGRGACVFPPQGIRSVHRSVVTGRMCRRHCVLIPSGVVNHCLGKDSNDPVYFGMSALRVSRVDSACELLLPPRVLQQSHDPQANPREVEQTCGPDSVQSLPHVGVGSGGQCLDHSLTPPAPFVLKSSRRTTQCPSFPATTASITSASPRGWGIRACAALCARSVPTGEWTW